MIYYNNLINSALSHLTPETNLNSFLLTATFLLNYPLDWKHSHSFIYWLGSHHFYLHVVVNLRILVYHLWTYDWWNFLFHFLWIRKLNFSSYFRYKLNSFLHDEQVLRHWWDPRWIKEPSKRCLPRRGLGILCIDRIYFSFRSLLRKQ